MKKSEKTVIIAIICAVLVLIGIAAGAAVLLKDKDTPEHRDVDNTKNIQIDDINDDSSAELEDDKDTYKPEIADDSEMEITYR